MSLADNSVKNWRSLPISNPELYLYNNNAHTKFGEIHWYLLNLSSRNENIDVSWADNCQKIEESCPLAIQNQIATISMHTPFGEIHWYLLKISSRNKTSDVSRADNAVKNWRN